ncbi:MAG TPA: site-specific integrase [Niabella sp.]|nr:site-specific integrase [Niabella sp.]
MPEKWLKSYPILKEEHPGPDHISVVYADIIKSLLFQRRVGNASVNHASYRSFVAFRGNIRFSQITSAYLKEYEAWMINDLGNTKSTVGIYCRALRAIVNEAIERRLISKDAYPFGRRKYGIPTGRNIKKAMSEDTIAKIYYTETEKSNQEKAKDFWFFSFIGNGMNIKDIINLKYKNINGSTLTFERAKTEYTARGREPIIITCHITEDMWRVIEKWGNKNKDPENYIFPVLSPGLSTIDEYRIKKNFVRFINKNMAKVSLKAKIEKPAKTMEARHSFSTILKNAEVSPYYVKEALGHASLKTTENYFGGFENDKKMQAADIISRFKTKKANTLQNKAIEESNWRGTLISMFEKRMEPLRSEQIKRILLYIGDVLKERNIVQ